MLTTEKKEYFKEMLTQNLLQLMDQSNKTVVGSYEFEERHPDFLDLALVESNAGMSLHITERNSKLIAKIKYALEKLEKGEFGICEECGEEISEERLMARPIANLCINCKRRQEKVERLRGL